MNAKKAKALRRQVREAAAKGLPEKSYLLSRFERTKNVQVNKDGKPMTQKVKITSTTVSIDPDSVRGAYRNLKRLQG